MQKLTAVILLAVLSACADQADAPAFHEPNNTIAVVRQQNGQLVALPPTCAPWDAGLISQYQNDPLPQMGCTTAGNLAQMVVNPADLVRGELPPRATGTADGGLQAAALGRYWAGKDYEPAAQQSGTSAGSGSSDGAAAQ